MSGLMNVSVAARVRILCVAVSEKLIDFFFFRGGILIRYLDRRVHHEKYFNQLSHKVWIIETLSGAH